MTEKEEELIENEGMKRGKKGGGGEKKESMSEFRVKEGVLPRGRVMQQHNRIRDDRCYTHMVDLGKSGYISGLVMGKHSAPAEGTLGVIKF